MCRLLSVGKKRAGKGACHLNWPDVAEWNDGLIAMLVPDRADDVTQVTLSRVKRIFGDLAYMALSVRLRPRDAIRLRDLLAIAVAARVPTVATNDVLYHALERRLLPDVVTCIRKKCTVDRLGYAHERFADRYRKTVEDMERLSRRYPKDPTTVWRSVELAARCTFSLDELKYQYHDEIHIPGRTPQQELERLTWEKAPERYPNGIEGKVREQLEH